MVFDFDGAVSITEDDRDREYTNVLQIYNILRLKLKHLAEIRALTVEGTLDDAVGDIHSMETQTVKIFGELMVKKRRLLEMDVDVLPVDISNHPTME